jgi:hypothetical protein
LKVLTHCGDKGLGRAAPRVLSTTQTLMIKRIKGIEIDEIQFNKTFEHIWFKCAFGPKFFEL